MNGFKKEKTMTNLDDIFPTTEKETTNAIIEAWKLQASNQEIEIKTLKIRIADLQKIISNKDKTIRKLENVASWSK